MTAEPLATALIVAAAVSLPLSCVEVTVTALVLELVQEYAVAVSAECTVTDTFLLFWASSALTSTVQSSAMLYPESDAAFAGTMTRLKIIVNASSDERNFFIIFFILSHFCDLAPRAQSRSHTSAFYHAAGNKGTEKCKIHKFFIFPFARLPLVSLIRRKKRRFCFTKSQIFQNFLRREKPPVHIYPRRDLTE